MKYSKEKSVSHNQQFWQKVLDSLTKSNAATATFVVSHTNHSPGTAGARILLVDDEDPWGTIGGGIMEKNLLERMQNWLSDDDFVPFYETLVHQKNTNKSDTETPSGLICAGRQTNLYFRFTSENDLIQVQKINRLIESGKEAYWQINPSGLSVSEAIFSQKHTIFVDGDAWYYQEQLYNPKQVLIVGGGHCALALSDLLFALGYAVVIVDTRADVHTAKQLKNAEFVVLDTFKDAGRRIKYPQITEVIIMTAGALTDVDALLGILPFDVPFIGVMGSLSKRKFINDQLKKADVTEADLKRITAPIGLDIGSNTPQEIGVSIAAQLIQRRNLGTSI